MKKEAKGGQRSPIKVGFTKKLVFGAFRLLFEGPTAPHILLLNSLFVRDGIYNSVADYNSTWRVSCVSVCLSRGKLRSWITFERFELEG